MWARLCIAGVAAGCYSGHAAPGAPCTPSLDNCPQNQTCALVSGEYVCVEGAVADASLIDSTNIDARVDARPLDGGVDALMLTPWTLVQTAQSTAATTTIASSGSSHLIVVAVETTNAGPVTAMTDNAGNTYTAVTNGRAVAAAFGVGLELWYAANSQPGATTITVTAPTVYAVVAWEVRHIQTAAPLQTATKLDDQAASTMPVGASITTTQTGELVIAAAVVDNQVSGIHAGSLFTNDRTTFGNGWAHLTSNSAPAGTYQAAWDQPTAGASCAVSAAFFDGL